MFKSVPCAFAAAYITSFAAGVDYWNNSGWMIFIAASMPSTTRGPGRLTRLSSIGKTLLFFTALMLGCPEEGPLRDLFFRRFYQLWLDRVYTQDRLLQEFRGPEHEGRIAQFRASDRAQWERLGPARIREAVLNRRQPA